MTAASAPHTHCLFSSHPTTSPLIFLLIHSFNVQSKPQSSELFLQCAANSLSPTTSATLLRTQATSLLCNKDEDNWFDPQQLSMIYSLRFSFLRKKNLSASHMLKDDLKNHSTPKETHFQNFVLVIERDGRKKHTFFS